MYNEDDEQRTSDEDYMRELYLRFRKEVESGSQADYYELNELLDIYDYAQDEGDVLVQMFVFLVAARLYPGNHDFDERMAFFLSYVSQDAAKDMFDRGGRQESALWDVLAMGVKCYPAGDPSPYIDSFLEKYSSVDCETTLKLIDLLRDMERQDLLVKYYPELSKRAEDPRGLAFEIAEILKERDEHIEDGRKIAEELTGMDPFDIESWLLLARLEFTLNHPEEALAAVDYALAINPDHQNARLTRGVIMVVMDSRRKEAVEVLEGILAEQPENPYALEGVAEAYSRSGMKDKAIATYLKIITDKIAISTDPILSLVELEPENFDECIGRCVDIGTQTDSDWRTRAICLMDKEKLTLAARMLDSVYHKGGLGNDVQTVLHAHFDAGLFRRYTEIFEEECMQQVKGGMEPTVYPLMEYLLLAVAYLRSGQRENAKKLSEAILARPDDSKSIDSVIKHRGIFLTARLISTMASSTEISDEELERFDPFSPSLVG